ncbi:hypothetical protein ONE63_008052 [Megalurothrips usitatus]|uniref:SGNH hydrolase-type esterase domain-containing protein n=1 Tax=Megalurothrips usitatus TaxID=439358 RepID=A0AAV7XPM4_9NEOP|nr:hypothetical protein ONE63_008052 [Megalurothrips usitatus]
MEAADAVRRVTRLQGVNPRAADLLREAYEKGPEYPALSLAEVAAVVETGKALFTQIDGNVCLSFYSITTEIRGTAYEYAGDSQVVRYFAASGWERNIWFDHQRKKCAGRWARSGLTCQQLLEILEHSPENLPAGLIILCGINDILTASLHSAARAIDCARQIKALLEVKQIRSIWVGLPPCPKKEGVPQVDAAIREFNVALASFESPLTKYIDLYRDFENHIDEYIQWYKRDGSEDGVHLSNQGMDRLRYLLQSF